MKAVKRKKGSARKPGATSDLIQKIRLLGTADAKGNIRG